MKITCLSFFFIHPYNCMLWLEVLGAAPSLQITFSFLMEIHNVVCINNCTFAKKQAF